MSLDFRRHAQDDPGGSTSVFGSGQMVAAMMVSSVTTRLMALAGRGNMGQHGATVHSWLRILLVEWPAPVTSLLAHQSVRRFRQANGDMYSGQWFEDKVEDVGFYEFF